MYKYKIKDEIPANLVARGVYIIADNHIEFHIYTLMLSLVLGRVQFDHLSKSRGTRRYDEYLGSCNICS